MITKCLQILGLQPRISKVFLDSLEQFFLTVGQNNVGNKIADVIYGLPLTCVPNILDPDVGTGSKEQPMNRDEQKANHVGRDGNANEKY